MDIAFGAQAEAFRAQFRAWLAANLPPGWGTPACQLPATEEERVRFRLDWERRLSEAGYSCPQWPVEYGGRGLSLLELVVLYEENGRVGTPDQFNSMGKAMLGPTLMQFGTEWQKRRFLPKIRSNEEIWCQGFSEPDAGSDLANLSTRAALDGDQWSITGHKTWTSRAGHADWCFVLARTDPAAAKHKGITFFLVPLRQPGITVRPVRQITGDDEFYEVFFEGARTAPEHVVGEVNDGWRVAMSLLSFERGFNAITKQARLRALFDRLMAYARQVPRGGYARAVDDPYLYHRFLQLDLELEALRLTNYRYVTRYVKGETPGSEASVTKIMRTELGQRIGELALEVMGPYADLDRGAAGAPGEGDLIFNYLESRGYTIAGGTSEIQRTIIAERLLGLPR